MDMTRKTSIIMGTGVGVAMGAAVLLLVGGGAATDQTDSQASTDASISPSPTSSLPSPTAAPEEPPEYAFRYSGWEDQEVGGYAPINTDGTYGSGCTPPGTDTLPDGVWAGFLTAWGEGQITFDLACYYAPESAYTQRLYDECIRTTPADSRYYSCDRYLWGAVIENGSTRVRSLDVAEGAEFISPDDTFREWSQSGLLNREASFPDRPMWVYLNGGLVTQMHEDPEFYFGFYY